MSDVRTCTLCNHLKPVTEYNFRNTAKGIRHERCKQCVSTIGKQQRVWERELNPPPPTHLEEAVRRGVSPCSECGEEKTLSHFYVRFHEGHRLHLSKKCKSCERSRYRKWMKTEHYRDWRLSYRLKRYGITKNQYDQMKAAQKDLCAVCSRPLLEGDEVIDHDHTTGEVRGLLHRNCNLAIGNAGDDPDVLLGAAIYLESHRPSN